MHIGICYLEKERNWFHHALLANTIFTISHTFCANICFHSANAIIHLAFCNNRLKSILDNITTFCDIFVSANTSIQTKNRQTWEHQELRYCAMHFLRQDFTNPETYLCISNYYVGVLPKLRHFVLFFIIPGGEGWEERKSTYLYKNSKNSKMRKSYI